MGIRFLGCLWFGSMSFFFFFPLEKNQLQSVFLRIWQWDYYFLMQVILRTKKSSWWPGPLLQGILISLNPTCPALERLRQGVSEAAVWLVTFYYGLWWCRKYLGSLGRTRCQGITDSSVDLSPPYARHFLASHPSRHAGESEQGATEDERAGWHHQLYGHEFEGTPGVGDGQGGLVWCSPWGHKESDTNEWLNWTEYILGQSADTGGNAGWEGFPKMSLILIGWLPRGPCSYLQYMKPDAHANSRALSTLPDTCSRGSPAPPGLTAPACEPDFRSVCCWTVPLPPSKVRSLQAEASCSFWSQIRGALWPIIARGCTLLTAREATLRGVCLSLDWGTDFSCTWGTCVSTRFTLTHTQKNTLLTAWFQLFLTLKISNICTCKGYDLCVYYCFKITSFCLCCWQFFLIKIFLKSKFFSHSVLWVFLFLSYNTLKFFKLFFNYIFTSLKKLKYS